MNKKTTKQFTSELSQIGGVRDFIRSSCCDVFTESTGDTFIDLIVLAVNEAFNNIVVHGYHKVPGKQITIQSEVTDSCITFELADKGDTFDINAVPEPDFGGSRENGYGIYIIREVMDKVSYTKKRSVSDWNRLKLVKKR